MRDELLGQGYQVIQTHLVKFPDCNATNNLFGGQMLRWMDEAAGIYAARATKSMHIVTRMFGGVPFEVPIERGMICTIYCKTVHEGNTSIKVDVIVTKSTFSGDNEVKVAQTDAVFVALDSDGKPRRWRTTP